MPRKGFKSITVKEEIYDAMLEAYETHKTDNKFGAIQSFSGFVTFMVWRGVKCKN